LQLRVFEIPLGIGFDECGGKNSGDFAIALDQFCLQRFECLPFDAEFLEDFFIVFIDFVADVILESCGVDPFVELLSFFFPGLFFRVFVRQVAFIGVSGGSFSFFLTWFNISSLPLQL